MHDKSCKVGMATGIFENDRFRRIGVAIAVYGE
jgi:hypothetical protein